MLHIFMLFILIVIGYYFIVSYGYISVLAMTTSVLQTEPHQIALKELGAEAPINRAIQEIIWWRRIVLLSLAVGINWIAFWYILGSSEDVNYVYQIITSVVTSGCIAAMYTKNFMESWARQLLLIGEWTSNRLRIHLIAKLILADSEEIMNRMFLQTNPLSEDEQAAMMDKLREYDRHSTTIQEYNDVLKSAIKSIDK